MDKGTDRVRVWDPIVRIFHWTLVLAFFTAYIAEDHFPDVHAFAGYTVFSLVLFRILWGIWGPQHARFSDFIYHPRVVLKYLTDLIWFQARRYMGHGPAGGTMVIALLVSLLLTTISGLALYGSQEYSGPLVSLTAGIGEEGADLIEEVHEFLAGFTLLLVGIHVMGVLFSSLAHRENLIKAMLTGYKVKEKGLQMRSAKVTVIVFALLITSLGGTVEAKPAEDLLTKYREQGAANMNAKEGEALWGKRFKDPESGEERACTTCHTNDLQATGRHAKTGKPIAPMASSVNAKRLSDPKFIEKWFSRNCKWTLGRECTPGEKASFLLFIQSQ